MRYTKVRVWVIFSVIVIGIIVLLNYSFNGGPFKSTEPITDEQVKEAYPRLYEAIVQRREETLKPFLSHENIEVRNQGWRALANTPVESITTYIELAREQNTDAAWFALSKHEFSGEQLRQLEELWLKKPALKPGITRVLGLQGDRQSLQFLLKHLDTAEQVEAEYALALALGRLTTRFELTTEEQLKIIRSAFETSDSDTRRAYLYGWYRGPKTALTNAAKDSLFQRWRISGPGRIDVDQYVNKLLPRRTTYTMTVYYNGEQLLNKSTQLAVELASSLAEIELDRRNQLAAKILLTNTNPHVRRRALQSLDGRVGPDDRLYTYIKEDMLSDQTLPEDVWIKALQVVAGAEEDLATDYQERLNQIPTTNIYLLPEVLDVYNEILDGGKFIRKAEEFISTEEPRSMMYVMQGIHSFWQSITDSAKAQYRDRIREIVFKALALRDRGVTYVTAVLIEDERLFNTEDFETINETLRDFSLPEDVEVFQVFGSLYKNRFEEQAAPIIDTWVKKKYEPLNRSLAAAGWNVAVSNARSAELRTPDWNRLWELGQKPVLRFRTHKGLIDVQLNTLVAPATVSAIDSLVRAQEYDSVAFHRVVPNFVIQGGDIERGDGFGGAGFVLPIEASEVAFHRGAAGIASAGPDTEGSQYFFMHQWKPHLNGNYTRFGKVVNGMRVVDNITAGDSVLTVRWN